MRLIAFQMPGVSRPLTNPSISSKDFPGRKHYWSKLLWPMFDVLYEEAKDSIYRVRKFTQADLMARVDGTSLNHGKSVGP